MAKESLRDRAQRDFEAISLYYLTGDGELNEEQKYMMNRMRDAYGFLRENPRKHLAIKKLLAAYPSLSESQANLDINNAMKFWNKHNSVDREFVEAWFVDFLIGVIVDSEDEWAQAKNLATLQKYIASMPPTTIDPKHVERNNVYIQFNVNNSNFKFSEKELTKLPLQVRTRMLEAIPHEITEGDASEMINS